MTVPPNCTNTAGASLATALENYADPASRIVPLLPLLQGRGFLAGCKPWHSQPLGLVLISACPSRALPRLSDEPPSRHASLGRWLWCGRTGQRDRSVLRCQHCRYQQQRVSGRARQEENGQGGSERQGVLCQGQLHGAQPAVRGEQLRRQCVSQAKAWQCSPPVYAIEATCHAPTFEGIYGEIYKCLKPGGIVSCILIRLCIQLTFSLVCTSGV